MRRLNKRKKKCTMGDLWKCLNIDRPEDAPASLHRLAPSEALAKRMLAELAKVGREWEALTAYAKQSGWLDDKSKGVKVGEIRPYVVQQHGQFQFIRVPVGPLRVARGQTVQARFNPGNIVISAS